MKSYKIPYWITDYVAIRKENYYYVDKTYFIPFLEEAGKYLIYLRPRRFWEGIPRFIFKKELI